MKKISWQDLQTKLLHKIIDKGTSLMQNILTMELLKIQSYPTQPKSQFSHTSQGGQGNQKRQRRPNRNSYECHLCGQTGHLMAFCPNKPNRLAAPVAQEMHLLILLRLNKRQNKFF
ncbi:hypothetical protein M9H77_07621 [Catharanthus roseus]|uniref:Uncharacterized protein n=1 Tax=Catharanthus roseus TaxID=4058 RepID=A0ACC0BVK1_CATRO|nr:hypothetical protein M9H77_07621 [Catharanthus roseus]